MTDSKLSLDAEIADFEQYYSETFVIDNSGEFTRVRELALKLIADRQALMAVLDRHRKAFEVANECFNAILDDQGMRAELAHIGNRAVVITTKEVIDSILNPKDEK